jgi:hypothetical protein
MPKRNREVIPITRDPIVPDTDREVVDLAYDLWLARSFRGGSPEEDLLIALREVRGKRSAVLFLVPERERSLPPLVAMRCCFIRGGSQ